MESLGVDPLFYSLHIGIDNPTSGHGAMARRAVELYLDEVRASSGDQAMQATWSRVWDGYVAFATTGGLGQDFRRRVREQPNPGQRVYEMILRKAHFGAQNHGTRRLGDNLINNWFADPVGFMRELANSSYIVPGDVEASPFFELFRPTGPMFRIFTDEEARIWEDWVRSLADDTIPSEPETDPGRLMVRLIDTLRSRQRGVPAHTANQLKGPDGATHPVAWWFDQPTPDLLRALSNPDNEWITPGDPRSSRFITQLASGDHPMARVLGEVAPGTAHKTWRTIAIDWIAAGCPVPAPNPALPAIAAAALSESDEPAKPTIPLLGIFQNETWQPEYDAIPIYGNGALH
jgi:hypothetical protein